MKDYDYGKRVILSEEEAKNMSWNDIIFLLKKYDSYDLTSNVEFSEIEQLLINGEYKTLNKHQYKVFYNVLKHSGVSADSKANIMESQVEAMIIRAFYREHYEYNELRKKFGGGCYIATSAYGDYNHPQVIKLRRFRDNSLEKTVQGRFIIKVYYLFSPIIIKLFGKIDFFNKINRIILNKFIELIDSKKE